MQFQSSSQLLEKRLSVEIRMDPKGYESYRNDPAIF